MSDTPSTIIDLFDPEEDGDFRVFGYGSLMWRPGFDYMFQEPAVAVGYKRSFCVWSHWHRGTEAHPGLVLGLDPKPGDTCPGVAFQISATDRKAVMAYLTDRELRGYAYRAEWITIELEGGRTSKAWTFVADSAHPLYAGQLDVGYAADFVMQAEGTSGLNRDYLINTVRHLEASGCHDADMHALLVEIERRTGMIDIGSFI